MENLQYLALNSLKDVSTISPISDEDHQCLQEIRDILKKHKKMNRFGITLLHKHFDLLEDELLVESVDEEKRVQTIQPMKISEISEIDGQILETMWCLEDSKALVGCRRACVKTGDGHSANVHVNT